jgi:diacylglycerol O-acyltransferase / wax synthase
MAYAHFERLSAMDLSFLAMENGRAHMHIGSVSTYHAGPLRGDDGGTDFERVLGFAQAQLHKFPRLRPRLEWVPGLAQPGWVDDDRFNLRFHLRHTALPPPGDDRLLKRLAGRVLSQEFDRAKPLWEYWLVDGLTGDRVAVITKVHHCLADGISGVTLGNLLVGPDPRYEPPPRRAWVPRPAPSGVQLVADELRHRITTPMQWVQAVRRGRRPGDPRSIPALRSGLRSLVGTAVQTVSPTPLNVEAGPHRRFDWTRMPLGEVRQIGKQAGGTVNDVVLAVATGALRTFLRQRGMDVDHLDFRAVVPVNVRGDDAATVMGNRVSEMIVPLPLAETDARRRLLAVIDLTHELKASGQSDVGDLLGQAIDLLPARVLGPLFRLAARSPVANLIMTNVPGPRVPVYLLGARQLETYPVVPLLARQALGIAVMSYDDGMFWGFNADWDAMPDLHDLVGYVDRAFAELSAIDPAGRASAAPPVDA